MSANSAALAVKEIGYEITFFILIDTSLRTEYLAHPAFNTPAEIVRRPLGTPVAGFILAGITGLSNNAANLKFFPCQLIF
jgi:hypothetical protein